MKEKKTKHKVRRGWRLWMTPQQARETSVNDLIKVTNKILNRVKDNE